MNRMNILFVSTDEMSFDALSCHGNPYVSTPNMDELLGNGCSFENSYCTDPVCAPARGSWMTGLYSSETGLSFNDGSLHEDIPDLGEILSKGGYYAAHSGKWHVLGREIDRGFHVLYDGKRKILASSAEIYDNMITVEAVNFLNRYDGDRPFFLQAHYVNPHDVCELLHSYEDSGKKIADLVTLGVIPEEELPPLPPNFDYDKRETVLQIVCRRKEGALIHEKIRRAVEQWTEQEWRCYLWQYYRYVEKTDKELGCLLNALKASRFRENTVVIFTVDHGEGCAKHRMFQKFTLYEESIKVPFCIATYGNDIPIKKGWVDRKHYVSGVDIVKTVCDIAGIEAPEHAQGFSAFPYATGQEGKGREFAYVESNLFGRAIIKALYKLITEYKPNQEADNDRINGKSHELGRCQLFDLEQDPYETKNIAGEHEKIVKEYLGYLEEMEQELHQREIPNEKGQKVLKEWSKAIDEYWNHLATE